MPHGCCTPGLGDLLLNRRLATALPGIDTSGASNPNMVYFPELHPFQQLIVTCRWTCDWRRRNQMMKFSQQGGAVSSIPPTHPGIQDLRHTRVLTPERRVDRHLASPKANRPLLSSPCPLPRCRGLCVLVGSLAFGAWRHTSLAGSWLVY